MTNSSNKQYKKLLNFFIIFFLNLFLNPLFDSAFAASPFTSAYTTLSNSRFSFRGTVATGGVSDGATSVTIKTSGQSDNNTGNIFNGDSICFNTVISVNGCANNKNFTVTNIPNNTNNIIYFTPALSGTLVENDRIIATQSGRLTITFKPQTALVSGDKLVLDLIAAATTYNDGIPDTSGFDSAALPSDLMNDTGCTSEACFDPTGFTASIVTLNSTTNLHTITITLSSTLNTSTNYYFILGHSNNAAFRFLNPSPSGTLHVRGTSDSYSIRLRSRNSSQTITYNDTTMKINPIDGVFVSANVELALTYKINESSTAYVDARGNLATSQNITECNGGTFSTSIATNATSIPFKPVTSTDTFIRGAQTHYIQNNITNGYSVTVQYDNPLTKYGSKILIKDGNCDGKCNSDTNAAWKTSTNNGFGYTLGNITGSAASFTGTTFKIFASSPKIIMDENVKTNGSRVAICYQLSVNATQETGLYYNKLTYIAIPKF